MIPAINCVQTTELGAIERTKRPDGKINVWRFQFHRRGDTLPRWVLINVQRNRRKHV